MKLRITVEGKVYDVNVEVLDEAADELSDDQEMQIPDAFLKAPPPRDELPEDRICRSPIAGVITSVTAIVGQRVRKDDPLLTIEAMKMVSKIGAPIDGAVKAIHVAPGETVRAGQVLVELA